MDLLRSLPIGLYLDQPITRLHQLDARVKFIWLMAFLAAPLLANPWWRLALVGLLMFLTLLAPIPPRVWRQQMADIFSDYRLSDYCYHSRWFRGEYSAAFTG